MQMSFLYTSDYPKTKTQKLLQTRQKSRNNTKSLKAGFGYNENHLRKHS